MSSIEWPFAALAAMLAGPVMFARGFKTLRMRQLMLNTPTARIRSMAMGLVEVNGTVAARSTVTAPFSGRPCAYWEIDIATRGRNVWNTVHRNCSGNPFFLRDETGVALVYPRGAESKVHLGVSEECMGVTLPAFYAQYLEEQNLAMRHVWRMGEMRFRERILEEGQSIFVLGTAMPRPRALAISEEVVLQATGTDDRHTHQIQTTSEEVSAVIRQGVNERTFVISQESERSLGVELGFIALAKLVGGPLLALAGLAYWLDRLGHGHPFRF
jgi:hypothetical protein